MYRNRAKCLLCEDIIESTSRHDNVSCKCGEISVDGGMDYPKVSVKNWKNFIRVDDNGNEIVPLIYDKEEKPKEAEAPRLTRDDMIKMLDEKIKYWEGLPKGALEQTINHYDLLYFMILVSSILKAD